MNSMSNKTGKNGELRHSFGAKFLFYLFYLQMFWAMRISIYFFIFLCRILANAQQKPPVIFIHGILGSKLYAKGTNVEYPEGIGLKCEKNFDWKRVWISPSEFVGAKRECAIRQMKLYYNQITGKYQNLPGIEISATKPDLEWGNTTDSVMCMMSDELFFRWGFVGSHPVGQIVGNMLACEASKITNALGSDTYVIRLVEYLVSSLNYGLLIGDGFYVAAYDWRHNYNSEAMSPYYDKLTNLIERVVRTYGKKVTFIAHSMGNLVLSHFMQLKGKEWLKKHVFAQINVAPPFGGSVATLSALKDSFNVLGITNEFLRDLVAFFASDVHLNYLIRSTPAAAVLLPRQHSFGRQELFRDLELRRNFGADEIVEFLNYLDLPEMAEIYNATNEMKLPPEDSIEIHCVISSTENNETAENYVYTGSNTTFAKNGPGDGRVNGLSMEKPCVWLKEERQKKGFQNVDIKSIEEDTDHMEILQHRHLFRKVGEVLSKVMRDESPEKRMLKRMVQSGEGVGFRANLDIGGDEGEGKMAPKLVDLEIFFETLAEYRRKKKMGKVDADELEDEREAKMDPNQRWKINAAYGEKGWNQKFYEEEKGAEKKKEGDGEKFGMGKLLESCRRGAEKEGNNLVLLKRPGDLGPGELRDGGEEWDGVDMEEEEEEALARLVKSKEMKLKYDLEGMLEDLKATQKFTIKLIPLGVLVRKEEAKGAANSIKFLILGVTEQREKIDGKSIEQILKRCDHVLLEFFDPKLDRNSIQIDKTPSRNVSQIPKYLRSKLNLTSVDFALSSKEWSYRIAAENGANLGAIVEEFMEMIKQKWTVKTESQMGSAEDFALVREELTDWKLGLKMNVEFKNEMMTPLRLKWQKMTRFVRFKDRFAVNVDILGSSVESQLAHFLKTDMVFIFPLATTGKDSIFFLMLSTSGHDGVLKVDSLKEYFDQKHSNKL